MDIHDKVFAAFEAEHKEQLEGIRGLLSELSADVAPDDRRLEEAFRLAHTLKGGARVCDLREAEMLGHHLESLFSHVRQGQLHLDHGVVQVAHLALDAIEDWMTALVAGETLPAPDEAIAAIEALLKEQPSAAAPTPAAEVLEQQTAAAATPVTLPDPKPLGPPASGAEDATPEAAAAAPANELVRVSADSLDRLVRSTGAMVHESRRHEMVHAELAQLQDEFEQLERQREAMHDSISAALHQLLATAQYRRVVRYTEEVNRQLRQLGRSVRRVARLHERASWPLRTRAAAAHRDARDARMVSADSVFQGLRKMVRDLAQEERKQVEFVVSGLHQRADRLVLQSLKAPLMHILCNAVVHGIESPAERQRRGKNPVGRVSLAIEVEGSRLRLLVEDDGRGIDLARVAEAAVRANVASPDEVADRPADERARWIFEPGVSTTQRVSELAGRGMGLSVAAEAVRRLNGEVQVRPRQSPGTCLAIYVPLSVSTHRLLRVVCRKQKFAVPVANVRRLLRIPLAEVETMEGRPIVWFQRQPVPLIGLPELLEMSEPTFAVEGSHLCALVLQWGGKQIAVGVDALLEERESLIQELTGPAASVTKFSGAILGEDATVTLILNPAELVGRVPASRQLPSAANPAAREEARPRRILVVDDSFTARTLEKSILESHGYEVSVAVDGVDAMARLRSEAVDAVLCDVEMPRMDGFQMLAEIKKDDRLRSLPIILVTSRDCREDQQRGLSLGADAYIVKQKFDHRELLTAIEQVI